MIIRKIFLSSALISLITLCSCRGAEVVVDGSDTLPPLPARTTVRSLEPIILEPETVSETSSAVTTAPTETTKNKTELATTVWSDSETVRETEVPTVPTVPDVPAVALSDVITSATETSAAVTETASSAPDSSAVTPSESASSAAADTASVTSGLWETATVGTSGSSSAETFYPLDEETRPYGYHYLDSKRKYIYDSLVAAAKGLKAEISYADSPQSFSPDEYREIYEMIYSGEPELFYIDPQMKYMTNKRLNRIASATVIYSYSDEEIIRMRYETEAEADKILSRISPGMTEWDIIKLFYDFIADSCDYDASGAHSRDIYGALVEKKAVCGGIAMAFYYLCREAGIEALTITGEADNVPHMWNMVRIGGNWYHIDVTAGIAGTYIRYDYFCVTDSQISKSRTVYKQAYSYPPANAVNYDYYIYNGLYIGDVIQTENVLYREILNATNVKRRVIQVKCSESAFEGVIRFLFEKNDANAVDILDRANESAFNKFSRDTATYNYDSESGVIKFTLQYV